MRGVIYSAVFTMTLLIPKATCSNGLLYKLPADGTSVKFDIEALTNQDGMQQTAVGTLKMSSVGTKTVDDEKCRWIEFNLTANINGQGKPFLFKVLIPEKHLGKGKLPLKNVKEAWFKPGDSEPREVFDFEGRDAGPLSAILSGPLKNEQKQKQETVESKLGKLKCAGITGSTKYKQAFDENEVLFDVRLHDKAPFGVVVANIMFKVSRNGKFYKSTSVKMKLADINKGAISEFPKSK